MCDTSFRPISEAQNYLRNARMSTGARGGKNQCQMSCGVFYLPNWGNAWGLEGSVNRDSVGVGWFIDRRPLFVSSYRQANIPSSFINFLLILIFILDVKTLFSAHFSLFKLIHDAVWGFSKSQTRHVGPLLSPRVNLFKRSRAPKHCGSSNFRCGSSGFETRKRLFVVCARCDDMSFSVFNFISCLFCYLIAA